MYEKIKVSINDNPVDCVTKWTTDKHGCIAVYIGSEFGASMWVRPQFIIK